MSEKFEELEIPPDALEQGGIEIVRASIVDGAVSVALRRAFDDPATWGRLLIDLARQAARAYAMEADLSEEEAFERIRAGWEAESLDPNNPLN
ncbi:MULTISPECIES: DUF5076 domain-containing protein [Methylorubrum]|jgi:hypothetical protein|uniref:Uncharacterized protein n=3 Tax=Methylorubrum TaxID=2282523 RepID=A0A177IXX3_9HYPH|nr:MULTISPECIES: DUF5076 domain-containing protein [Methylorubrum]ACB81066.1 conserved hypothetical protein [Methylorubrum populi BJ001]KAB7784756.1 hypothetical protein F8B43_2789 [Methylorubrum populi]MBA8912605.1 hypothetical protein [Methylorubrum thiocyanatum]OAH33694.1 hypothetical protein AX289_02315 [Methylorubrum populi]PZP73195.1 MAG: DUF5076 domain-containing protein [Methylorubrum populi]